MKQLIGSSGAHRGSPDEDFVYTIEEKPAVAEARDALMRRASDQVEALGKAREALPPIELKPDFKAVVNRLAGLRSEERRLQLRRSQLQDEVSRFQQELSNLQGLGPFLAAKLKPELDQQKIVLGHQSEDLKRLTESNTRLIADAESELRRIADEEFKRDWEAHTKILEQAQASAVKMDHKMIEAANVGIQIRSHESRFIEFGEKYVVAASGYIRQPGAGEWLERRKRGEFKGGTW